LRRPGERVRGRVRGPKQAWDGKRARSRTRKTGRCPSLPGPAAAGQPATPTPSPPSALFPHRVPLMPKRPPPLCFDLVIARCDSRGLTGAGHTARRLPPLSLLCLFPDSPQREEPFPPDQAPHSRAQPPAWPCNTCRTRSDPPRVITPPVPNACVSSRPGTAFVSDAQFTMPRAPGPCFLCIVPRSDLANALHWTRDGVGGCVRRGEPAPAWTARPTACSGGEVGWSADTGGTTRKKKKRRNRESGACIRLATCTATKHAAAVLSVPHTPAILLSLKTMARPSRKRGRETPSIRIDGVAQNSHHSCPSRGLSRGEAELRGV